MTVQMFVTFVTFLRLSLCATLLSQASWDVKVTRDLSVSTKVALNIRIPVLGSHCTVYKTERKMFPLLDIRFIFQNLTVK